MVKACGLYMLWNLIFPFSCNADSPFYFFIKKGMPKGEWWMNLKWLVSSLKKHLEVGLFGCIHTDLYFSLAFIQHLVFAKGFALIFISYSSYQSREACSFSSRCGWEELAVEYSASCVKAYAPLNTARLRAEYSKPLYARTYWRVHIFIGEFTHKEHLSFIKAQLPGKERLIKWILCYGKEKQLFLGIFKDLRYLMLYLGCFRECGKQFSWNRF